MVLFYQCINVKQEGEEHLQKIIKIKVLATCGVTAEVLHAVGITKVHLHSPLLVFSMNT